MTKVKRKRKAPPVAADRAKDSAIDAVRQQYGADRGGGQAPSGGGFRFPVGRDFVRSMNYVLQEYHPKAEADFDREKAAGKDVSDHPLHHVMRVLSDMASAETAYHAHRSGQQQLRDLQAALIAFIRAFPDEWRSTDDEVEERISHSRHELTDHVLAALSHTETLFGELPDDVQRIHTRWANAPIG